MLELQKQESQFVIDKLKESIVNQNIVNKIDEIKDCYFEIIRLQSERVSFGSNINSPDLTMFNFSSAKKNPKFNESTGIKRKMEELRNVISIVETDVQVKVARKLTLEQELSEMVSKEKIKSIQYNDLKKLAHQVAR